VTRVAHEDARALAARRQRIDRRDRAHAREMHAARDVLDATSALLARLRQVRDSHALERRFCLDAATSCDFTRVMLSRVDGDAWRPWVVSFTENPGFDRHFATHLRGARIPFAGSVAEDHARRTLTPIIFNPGTDAGTIPLPLRGLTSSYAVVPLVGSTGIFGLVHADHHPGPRHASPADRDALWLLVDGFSNLYERAVLTERLRAQHARLRQAVSDLDAEATAVLNAEIALDRDPLPHAHHAAPTAETVLTDARLTRRERDVAELMGKGYGNAAIARDLVIVPGTVKTHVKAVMRKLGAANRAEAIAIILGHRTRR
jgi:DNA-binding CsgD family transcriptional regulator